MGLIHAEIELVNASDISFAESGFKKEADIRRMKVNARVDSGALMLSINESICEQLGLKVRDRRIAQMADGSVREVDVVGPVEVRFANRMSTTNAMVLPANAEVLLGAIPMEEMDVLIHPASQQLIVNPEHPYKAQMSLK